jgi:hypothetical protein
VYSIDAKYHGEILTTGMAYACSALEAMTGQCSAACDDAAMVVALHSMSDCCWFCGTSTVTVL